MPMKIDSNSEHLIRRYLLGAVTEAEREDVESRLMVDDNFFQQIGLLEDELIDEYLDSDLSPKDRRQFEEIFLCAPERQQKLRFARALQTYATNAARAGASEDHAKAAPWWQPILALFNPPRQVLVGSLATAVVALLAGGPWTYLRISGLEQRIAALQAGRQDDEFRLRSLYEDQRVKTDQLAAQLRQEQEKWSAAQSGGGTGLRTTRFALASTISVLLSPGLTRGAGTTQRLEISEGTTLVRVKLDLPENRYRTYTAVLLSNGQEIFGRRNLKASETTDQITLNLDLPAPDLQSGDYEIRLFGPDRTEQFETYILRLARK